MATQVVVFNQEVKMFMYQIGANDVTFIGYSQGGIIGRFLVEQHNANGYFHTFISIAAPLAGQYGSGGVEEEFKSLLYLIMGVEKTEQLLTNLGGMVNFFDLLCSGQITLDLNIAGLPELKADNLHETLAPCAYWRNPLTWAHQKTLDTYFNRMNNQNFTEEGQKLKENFSNLKKLVMVGSPNDRVVNPWESSHFGFYPDGCVDSVDPMEETDWFKDDNFGLHSLANAGAIVKCESIANHTNIITDRSMYEGCVRPHIATGDKWDREPTPSSNRGSTRPNQMSHKVAVKKEDC
ncbi:lysosomal thioesterase PPT2-B-like [Symsagittifera roscoffensis]|uniref:lysosomal thioesterase PPT2-B-like n=1 Tax=Symsagittifera roscoffensis TaxID=84072 RepID=UPI00307BE4C9